VKTIQVLTAALLLMLIGCSQPNARVTTRFNRDAEVSGELPYNPLQWEVISSTLNHNDDTLATVLGNDRAIAYARKNATHGYPAGSVLSVITWSQEEDPRMVRWKHTGQGAIRRVPRSAIRPGSRGDLPVHPVWRFAVEKARLHGGKVPDGPSCIYSRTTGSSHALKIPHAQGGCRSGRRSRIARSIENFKWQVSRRFT